jgi:hypothetical protein
VRWTPWLLIVFLVPRASAQTPQPPPDQAPAPPAFEDTIDVVATTTDVAKAATLAPVEAIASRELDQFVPGQGFQGAVRLLPNVMSFGNGVSIKGGRVSQAGIQLEMTTLVDPASGVARVALPDDAIESVAVLPNPYAVEYGRFSSGLIVIQSRRARDRWKFHMNRFGPGIRTTNDGGLRVESFNPRFEVGGPLVKDRVFLEQSMQARYQVGDQSSVSEGSQRTTKALSTFTRLDAVLSPAHALVTTVGIFPGATELATVGTFTPADASVNIHVFGKQAALTERTVWSNRTVGETTFQWYESRTDVDPLGAAPMELQPDIILGNYFNTQHRTSTQYQFVEAVTTRRAVAGGTHALKFGVDVIHADYAGTSSSHTMLIERADGSLARSLVFSGASSQSVRGTDAGLFAQDRLQLTPGWHIETGVRLDRDGVLDTFNLSPRIGTAVQLGDSGKAVLRGGWGLFVERTPSMAGAFTSFETAVDTRYVVSPQSSVASLQSSVPVTQTVAPDLQTAASTTWDAAFDYRVSPRWALHTGTLNREGRHELIVTPIVTATGAERRLSSDGGSSYHDVEIGVRYTRGSLAEIDSTYTWSRSEGDFNTLSSTYDSVLAPTIGENAYARLGTDIPHRLLLRGRVMPRPKWLALAIFDWHAGVPYSVVNETLDFVGARNELRFPAYARLELGVERRFKIFGFQPWIGVRLTNALGTFLPDDVQNNTGSPYFGTFFNPEPRRLRGQVRFER